MVTIAVLFFIYVVIYCAFIVALIVGFDKVKPFASGKSNAVETFSIIVPFRTEEHNLDALLDSFARLDYPRENFELIFVNDASEDFSENLINKWRMNNGLFQTTMLDNIRLSGSPKKDAILRAMPIVKTNWVITTDADCTVPPNWLRTLDEFISKTDCEMIAGPVAYSSDGSFLHHFQVLDFLSLQGVTIGSFGLKKAFMCNGANFAYTKKLFNEIGRFDGNDQIASGDDVFLLQKAYSKFPEKVAYLRSVNAIVKTKPVDSWRELLQQRMRWGSKATSYDNNFAQDLAVVTVFANVFLVVAILLAAFQQLDWRFPVLLFVIKLIPDWILIAKSNSFFKSQKWIFPIFSSITYPLFLLATGLAMLVGNYSWKGRQFKK